MSVTRIHVPFPCAMKKAGSNVSCLPHRKWPGGGSVVQPVQNRVHVTVGDFAIIVLPARWSAWRENESRSHCVKMP